MDFHLIQPPNLTDSTRHHLNGFPPNLTTLFDQAGIQCYLNGFPPNSTTLFDQAGIQCNLNGFAPNSTRQAYNAISMDFHPIQPPNLTWSNWSNLTNVRAFESSSQWISTQIDRFNQASSQWIETDQIQPI